jgi:endonuclease YncB( thermonuclease family)
VGAAIACAVAAAVALPALAHAETQVIQGRVVGIADGDTLTVLDAKNVQHRIRLSEIDAPEKGQPHGETSRQNLARLAFDRSVRAECPKEDRFGRRVCRLSVAGRDVGLAQLDAGLAWWFRRYAQEQPPQERAECESAEDRARADGAGLWRDPQPVPPWEWRRGQTSDRERTP